ncbi:MAG: hypothetical protein Q8K30_05720 [Candidatus Gracilibacteria bacterium]|nr:hypothetical protein [Candidatus Gracilibacteria bacterium]
MTTAIAEKEFITIPKTQYNILKNIYELNKKQLDLTRIYDVEENLKTGNYKSVKIDDFINSI